MQKKIAIISYILLTIVSIPILSSVASEALSYEEEYQNLTKTFSSNPEKVLAITDRLIEKNSTTYTPLQLLNIYEMKLNSYLYTNNYPAAFTLIEKIKSIFDEGLSPVLLWKLNYLQAATYFHIEQGNKAVKYFLEAYKHIKSQQEYTYERERTENALGYTYIQLGFYKEAIPYLTDSFTFNKKNNRPIALSRSYNNLGEAYFGLKDYEKSKAHHLKSLAIRIENDLTFYASYSYHNLGLNYKVRAEYQKAEKNFLKAINIRQDNKFLKGLLASQLELAKLYIEMKKEHAGNELLLTIIDTAKTKQKYTTLSRAYKLQAELFQNSNQFEQAFYALNNYQNALKKIQLNINDAELSSYISQLSTVTKDLNILSLSKANEIHKIRIKSIAQRSNLIISFSLIIVAVLSVFLWLLHKKRKKIQRINHSLSITLDDLKITQKKLIESEKMSALTVLVSGVAHKINTPLGIGITAISHLEHSISNFSTLLKEGQVKKSTFTSFVDELEKGNALALSNLNNVAELVDHFKLLSTQLGDDRKEQFDVVQLLIDESEVLLSDIKDNKPVITVHGDETSLTNYPSALKKVIGHLVRNSIDHAFTEQKSSNIEMSVNIDNSEEYVEITYQDNGKGIAKDLVNKIFDPFYTSRMGGHNVGLGLSVVYNLIVQLMQGNIVCDVSEQNITSFKITLPIHLADN